MSEQQRQHYLRAFGIESYVPRWVLPGAAESMEHEFGSPVEEGFATGLGEESASQAGEGARLESKSGAARILEAKSPTPDDNRTHRKSREDSTQIPGSARPHRFLLNAWRVGEDLMVLDSGQVGQALPVERLLLNMCRALGYQLTALPAPEVLRWPLLRSGSTGESDRACSVDVQEARAMVQAYLAARHEKQPLAAILLMGADAARNGLPAAEVEPLAEEGMAAVMKALLGKSFPFGIGAIPEEGQGPSAATRTIVLPSLTALLKNPSLKKPTWKAIQHLRLSG